MGTNSVRLHTPRGIPVRALKYSWRRLLRRSFSSVIECGYDARAWACGLLAAAWVTQPAIWHASVPALPPDQIAILDPAADPNGLRQALARCAGRAHSGLAALGPAGPAVPGERPAEFDQVAGELV